MKKSETLGAMIGDSAVGQSTADRHERKSGKNGVGKNGVSSFFHLAGLLAAS